MACKYFFSKQIQLSNKKKAGTEYCCFCERFITLSSYSYHVNDIIRSEFIIGMFHKNSKLANKFFLY